MRTGLHNILQGFINGLTISLMPIQEGFVQYRGAVIGMGDALDLETVPDNLLLETGDKLLLD